MVVVGWDLRPMKWNDGSHRWPSKSLVSDRAVDHWHVFHSTTLSFYGHNWHHIGLGAGFVSSMKVFFRAPITPPYIFANVRNDGGPTW